MKKDTVLSWALMSVMMFQAAAALGQCGDNSPALPVPETRSFAALWPPSGFQPAQGAVQLPSRRDSTDYLSVTIPGFASGHELFQSVDVVGAKLYAAYNAGLSVWDVAADPRNPPRLYLVDGWRGDFEEFPLPGEASNFVEDVSAASIAVGTAVALSGLDQVGVTIWLDDGTGLSQVSQHAQIPARQVRSAALGADVYFFAAASAHGVAVFDAVSGDSLGSLGGESLFRRYLDVLERGGKIYAAASSGGSPGPSIREFSGSVNASPVRWDGSSLSGVKGLELFEIGGSAYLAFVRSHRIEIYDVSDCLDSGGCADLGAAVWETDLPGDWPSFEFLTFSWGPDGPYLYYGMETSGLTGTRKEMLFNLSNLGGSNEIAEITDGSDSYADACGNDVDYWGHYYDGNEHGLRGFHPRVGEWSGECFYRAANSVLDIHCMDTEPVSPTLTTSAQGGQFWLGSAATVSASEQGCSGPGGWSWFSDAADAVINASGASAAVSLPLCSGESCSPRTISVWAIKSDCAGAPDLTVEPASLTFEDPRPRVVSFEHTPEGWPPGRIDRCTLIEFASASSGRGPIASNWSIRSLGTGELFASGVGESWSWDTTGVEPTVLIFSDGFESGSTGRWGGADPPDGERIAVAVELSSPYGSDVGGAEMWLMRLGEPEFVGEQVSAEPDAGPDANGWWTLTAHTSGITEWRFEVQTDFGDIQDFGWQSSPSLRVQWFLGGLKTVRVWGRSCEEPVAVFVETSIDSGDTSQPPAVGSVWMDTIAGPGCRYDFSTFEWICTTGLPAVWLVGVTGEVDSVEADWDGDGIVDASFPFGTSPSYTFSEDGIYQVGFRARGPSGVSDWRVVSLTVESPLFGFLSFLFPWGG